MPKEKKVTTKKVGKKKKTVLKKKILNKKDNKQETKIEEGPVLTKKEKEEKKIDKKRKKATADWSLLRGMRDLLPEDQKYWRKCFETAQNVSDYFLYKKIETPVVEETKLFIRTVGKGTDIVDKEMYTFEDKDGKKVTLRPEGTASAARAFIGHGMWNKPQPVKLWYYSPMFRHDRPQAGRYRQFWQYSCECFGADDPSVDAENVLMAYNFFKDLNLPVQIRINSIGDPEERERYKQELITYLRTKRSYLCEDCKKRINRSPLRVLDCKQEECQPVIEGAPQIIDWLQEPSKNRFMTVLEYLDELGIPYTLDTKLVRGLDYYNGMVFEIYYKDQENETAQSALGGGGRYDLLIESMGGNHTPAVGFSIGVDRVVNLMKTHFKENNCDLPDQKVDIYLAHLGKDARRVALRLLEEIRGSGIKIGYNFFKEALKNQLEAANKLEVPYVLIIGQKELQDGTIIIRDMESGVQEIIDQKKIESHLKKKLKK